MPVEGFSSVKSALDVDRVRVWCHAIGPAGRSGRILRIPDAGSTTTPTGIKPLNKDKRITQSILVNILLHSVDNLVHNTLSVILWNSVTGTSHLVHAFHVERLKLIL